jgi:hypothetical protein
LCHRGEAPEELGDLFDLIEILEVVGLEIDAMEGLFFRYKI